MTELKRTKEALDLAIGELSKKARHAYTDQVTCEEACRKTLIHINAILNPPPEVETVEVELWAAYDVEGGRIAVKDSKEYAEKCDGCVAVANLTGTLTRPKPRKVETYTLELSKAEAETLLRVTKRVGGCPSLSRRKYIDAIGDKLRKMGVSDPSTHLTPGGGITFIDEGGLI